MSAEFPAVFATLKPILAKYEKKMKVKTDTPVEYTLLTGTPSPFHQHKGEPLYFGGLRLGKAYVSFHFMPLYMCPEMAGSVTPALKKRMQGKTCFNFKTQPEPELISDLKKLAADGVRLWKKKKWM